MFGFENPNIKRYLSRKKLSTDEKIAEFAAQLSPFLPDNTADYVATFLIENVVHFTVSKKRKTKLGDYRHPYNGKPHRISVNGDLNPYSFLITTLHEMAHLTTYEKYGNRVKPHGVHWKTEFKSIADPILNKVALPIDVAMALNNYLRNAKASSCSDDKLYRVLKRYDKNKGITLEELEIGDLFKLHGKIFVKGKKLRTRFECVEDATNKKYRVLGLAEVDKIESN